MNSDVYLIPKDELYHYGVKGMKWGVHRYKQYDGPHRGLKKRRAKKAQKVLTRLDEMKSDTKRMQRMDVAQKKSYENARKYWKDVEQTGKYRGNSTKRNVVKRYYDDRRSRSFAERNIIDAAQSAAFTAGQLFIQKQLAKRTGMDISVDAAQLGRQYVQNIIAGDITEEVANRVFGHF